MIPSTPTHLPANIIAGDSLAFNPTFHEYAASDGWQVEYFFQDESGAKSFNFPVTNGGAAGYSVNVAANVTDEWEAGHYQGFARATLNTTNPPTVKTVWRGFLLVLPDPSQATDMRSNARKVLDSLEAVLAGRATNDILDSMIEGTMIRRLPAEQLILLRDRYKAVVLSEEAAAKIRAKKGTGRNIFVRIGAPGGTPFAPNDSPYGLGYGGQRF